MVLCANNVFIFGPEALRLFLGFCGREICGAILGRVFGIVGIQAFARARRGKFRLVVLGTLWLFRDRRNRVFVRIIQRLSLHH